MINIARQKGVALITALMIVALATIVSASISTKLQLDIRRTGNIIASDQAKLYAYAAEELAKRYLAEDIKDNKIDHLNELWAQDYIFPLEDGTLRARLTDIQACININGLIQTGKKNPLAKDRLERLFLNLKLPTGLTQAIIDWIDTDQDTTLPDGAEDGHYTSLENPYRTANTYIRSLSELKLIKGFEKQETIEAIGNNVCTFDDSGRTAPINVNTAPLEVLLSLSDTMILTTAENIIAHRAETPFTDIKNFQSFSDLKTIIPDTKDLSTNTNYFMLKTDITIGEARITMYSTIYRGSDISAIRVLSRSQSVY